VWGARNIYTVIDAAGQLHEHIRIKGKLLELDEDAHNPLAPGDRVSIVDRDGDTVIEERLPRDNAVRRWNRKRRRIQTVAANVDLLAVVTNAGDPRHQPQFVDRVLAMAQLEHIEVIVVVNKGDLHHDETTTYHLNVLRDAGYPVRTTIASGETDVEALHEACRGRVVCLFGKSGVGKSSLINALAPGTDLEVGTVSHRYRRGRHTTTLAREVRVRSHGGADTVYIDTPGVREFDLFGYEASRIQDGFREFAEYVGRCRLPGCTHIHEPGCAILKAVEHDPALAARYRSYAAIVDSISSTQWSTA
jgi:ribosome biogenesis GTPase